MYNTNHARILHQNKIFETCSRVLEFFTISLKAKTHKKKNDNETFSYFLGLLKKRSVLFDMGMHRDDYLYLLLKMAKHAGKIVTFESESDIYDYLCVKMKALQLKNMMIERLKISRQTDKSTPKFSLKNKNGAIVIDFNTRLNPKFEEVTAADNLCDYCTNHNIIPNFIRINGEGNELEILNRAAEILQKYKPVVLLTCEEKHAEQDNILQTFKFLADLNYSGYFILDVMKIPVANFDFNIYQNPFSNFYCKDFVFE